MPRIQRNLGLPKSDVLRLPLTYRMKKRTSEMVRALVLLVFFIALGALGVLLVFWQFGVWKDAHFHIGWKNANPDEWYSSYVVFIGFFMFLGCALCVFNLLRYDLRSKRKLRE